jgi:acyl-CoA thioesterase I
VTVVFAYGTLRDAEYQQALFGRTFPTRPATLTGWFAVIAESGYLTVVQAPGETLSGDLVALDDAALAVADAWEEVPLYERSRVEAQVADSAAVSCWLYVRPSASRERAPAGMLARHERAAVLAQIRAFRLTCE